MSNTYAPERTHGHAALSVRRFHRQLIDAGLAPAPHSSQPPPRPGRDMAGSFGRRRQAENVAPPTLRDRLRDMLQR